MLRIVTCNAGIFTLETLLLGDFPRPQPIGQTELVLLQASMLSKN